MIEQIIEELKDYCNIEDSVFLKIYRIPKALPSIFNIQYNNKCVEPFLNGKVFLAGDQQLNPSLNAAMLSGEAAAMAVIKEVNRK